MKKYFLLLLLVTSIGVNNSVFSQDIIKTKSGEEIKTKLLKTTRKEATYKGYNDPEFSTYTMPYKELASIKKEGSKKEILFNHHLPRAYFSIAIGAAYPSGTLKSTSLSNPKGEAGFAKSVGFNIRYDAAIYIYRKLGISIGGGIYGYGFDYNRYAQAYGEFYNAGNNNGFYGNNSNGHNNSRNNWQFIYLMAGPTYSVKLYKRLTWDFRARAGLVSTTNPYISLSYYNGAVPGSSFYYVINSKTNNAFGFSIGTGFRLALSKRFALCLNADFFNTQPQIHGNTQTQYPPGSSLYPNGQDIGGSYSTKYKFSSINTSFGLAYQFKRKGNKYE